MIEYTWDKYFAIYRLIKFYFFSSKFFFRIILTTIDLPQLFFNEIWASFSSSCCSIILLQTLLFTPCRQLQDVFYFNCSASAFMNHKFSNFKMAKITNFHTRFFLFCYCWSTNSFLFGYRENWFISCIYLSNLNTVLYNNRSTIFCGSSSLELLGVLLRHAANIYYYFLEFACDFTVFGMFCSTEFTKYVYCITE